MIKPDSSLLRHSLVLPTNNSYANLSSRVPASTAISLGHSGLRSLFLLAIGASFLHLISTLVRNGSTSFAHGGNGDEERLSQRLAAADHHSISITPSHFQFTPSLPETQNSQKQQMNKWKYAQGIAGQLTRGRRVKKKQNGVKNRPAMDKWQRSEHTDGIASIHNYSYKHFIHGTPKCAMPTGIFPPYSNAYSSSITSSHM